MDNVFMTIAVIIPAFNEEFTIAKVVKDFYACDNTFEIYVVDNNSSDNTKEQVESVFKEVGCKGSCLFEPRQGKAAAVKKAFNEVDADIYVMVDADDTYSVEDIQSLIKPVQSGQADMVVGDRICKGDYKRENKRRFHSWGNTLVKRLINFFFKAGLSDILSGYRCFSKRFVKNYPIMCDGFALETDMTLHALDKGFVVKEVPIHYQDRPEGSESKLNTFQDGMLVLSTIFKILKNYRPLYFFGLWALIFLIMGLAAGSFPVFEYITERYIHRVPLAILATGLMIFSIISFAIGLILQCHVENHRFMYALQLLKWKK